MIPVLHVSELAMTSLNSLSWDPDPHSVRALLNQPGNYVPMCQIDTHDPDHAFLLTQNGVVTDSWTLFPPPGLRPLVQPYVIQGREYGHRSTSVGDVLRCPDGDYVVAPVGFVKI
jgi:hypothetical protein